MMVKKIYFLFLLPFLHLSEVFGTFSLFLPLCNILLLFLHVISLTLPHVPFRFFATVPPSPHVCACVSTYCFFVNSKVKIKFLLSPTFFFKNVVQALHRSTRSATRSSTSSSSNHYQSRGHHLVCLHFDW